jgi:hypothetical protein
MRQGVAVADWVNCHSNRGVPVFCAELLRDDRHENQPEEPFLGDEWMDG